MNPCPHCGCPLCVNDKGQIVEYVPPKVEPSGWKPLLRRLLVVFLALVVVAIYAALAAR